MRGDAYCDVCLAEGFEIRESARGKLPVTDGTFVLFGDLGLGLAGAGAAGERWKG